MLASVSGGHTLVKFGAELEIEGSAGTVLFGKGRRVLRQPQEVSARVSRSRHIGVEEKRGLVVTGIRAPVSYRLIDLRAENSTLVVAVKGVFQGG